MSRGVFSKGSYCRYCKEPEHDDREMRELILENLNVIMDPFEVIASLRMEFNVKCSRNSDRFVGSVEVIISDWRRSATQQLD
jgi:hypothetical protein